LTLGLVLLEGRKKRKGKIESCVNAVSLIKISFVLRTECIVFLIDL